MSGGTLVVRAPRNLPAEERGALSLCGNAVGYGATGGKLFIEGRVGQRVGVRNSGATVVVEGAGKYAFEYMTGGVGVVLGPVGPVIGSGLTGGMLFILAGEGLDERLHRDARRVPLRDEDEGLLHSLVEEHAKETGSPRAREFLADWPRARERFARIVPASA
jgi:glutamate synthase (NADPH/NADH) large chain